MPLPLSPTVPTPSTDSFDPTDPTTPLTTDIELMLLSEAWLTFGSFFGDALDLLRTLSPFVNLAPGPWAVLVAATNAMRHTSVCHLDTLASATGISRATAYRHLIPLREHGILCLVETPSNPGYCAGPTLVGFLKAFARDRAAATWPTRLNLRLAEVQESPSAAPKAPNAAQSQFETGLARETGLSSFNKTTNLNFSSSSQIEETVKTPRARPPARRADPAVLPQPAPTLPRDALAKVGTTRTRTRTPASAPEAHSVPRRRLEPKPLREAALRALTARHKLAYPEHSPPASFPSTDIERVVAASAPHEWTPEELDQAHLDAIDGASVRSKTQPPTVRFIWGDGYFLENASGGRQRRLAKTDQSESAKADETMKKMTLKIAEEKAVAAPDEFIAQHLARWLEENPP